MTAMRAPDKKYLHLITRVPLLPIETEKDYVRARTLLHELITKDESLEPSEIGYGKVLGKLVQDYSKHKTKELFAQQVPGNEILQSLMDDHNLNQIDIAGIAEMEKQNVNAYLKKRRPLPRKAGELLGKRFKVNPEIFTFSVAGMEVLPDEQYEDDDLARLKRRGKK